jgi:ethanolamine utilization protein EutN
MFVGRVIGTITSTAKDITLTGVKLLIVRLSKDMGDKILVAADASHVAGYGDEVYIVSSKEGANALNTGMVPVDASIVGIVDEMRLQK